MKTFRLNRLVDDSGVSGTGMVAEGSIFANGKVVVAWQATEVHSVVIYDSIEDVQKIHGHGGHTEVVFDDA